MKKTIFITVLIMSNITWAELKKSTPKVQPVKIEKGKPAAAEEEQVHYPREVWTFSYHEYGLLQQEQKEKFIKDFAAHSKQSMFLNQMSELKTKDTIKDALSSEKDWSRIEKKVNKYCQDQTHKAECDRIAATRDQVLMEFRAHK